MTDKEIMTLYEQGLSLDHIAERIVARETNMADAPKKKTGPGTGAVCDLQRLGGEEEAP